MDVSPLHPIPEETDHFGYWQSLQAELIWVEDCQGVCRQFYWRHASSFGCDEQTMVGQHIFQDYFIGQPCHKAVGRVIEQRLLETLEGQFDWQSQRSPIRLLLIPCAETQVMVVGFSQKNQSPSFPPEYYQQALTQIARGIRATLDVIAICQEAVNGIGKALQVSRCLLLVTDENQSGFRVEAEYRRPDISSCLGTQWPSSASPLLEQIYQTKQRQIFSVICNKLSDSQTVLAIPILHQGSIDGLLCLQQCDRPRQWFNIEKQFVQELAEQLGTAIAHANLHKELEQLHQTATEAARLKDDFLASTTHELRTPLNGIIGFLQLLMDDMADSREEEQEFIASAHNSALHLLNLINDILDVAKIESGQIDLELKPVSLAELLNNIDNFARPQLQNKGLSWDIVVPETQGDIVLYADFRRVYQVLLNLVGNAIKFTHEGGITITVELVLKPVIFETKELPGMIKISVSDTGIGVALDMQSKLFQNFSQVYGGHSRQYGGTGLGLAICKRLVEACGGRISFYSMGEGLGSTITFSLLLCQKTALKESHGPNPHVIS